MTRAIRWTMVVMIGLLATIRVGPMSVASFAQDGSVKASLAWNCTLHMPDTKEVETFYIHRQDNGYYGDGKWLYFEIIEDNERALVVANAIVGITVETGEDIVGSHTLVIDKRRHLARLSYNYLSGYPDKAFYGTCLPD